MNKRSFFIQRPLVCAALFFGGGILAGIMWPVPVYPAIGIGLFLSLVLIFSLLRAKRPIILGVCFLLLFGGMMRGALANHPSLPPEGSYRIVGTVSGLADVRVGDSRVKTLLRDVYLKNEQEETYQINKAYWTYYPGEETFVPLDGQKVAFTGRLYHPEGQVNPYGFDFRMFLMQKGITVGISGLRDRDVAIPIRTEHLDPWLRGKIWVANQLDILFGANSALPKALLIGDRTGLEEEVTQSFRDAGIAHILAISGLHVSLLMGILHEVLRFCGVKPKARFYIIFLVLLLYCRFLNFTASVLRAAIMTLILLYGRTLRKRRDTLTSLAAAFIVIVAMRPLDIMHVGFQLSFLAVLGIVITGDQLNTIFRNNRFYQNRILRWLALSYGATLSASVYTLVPVVNVFHQFSLVSLLVGPLAIAFVGILMPAYLLVIASALLWMPFAQLAAIPVNWMTGFFLQATSFFADLPYTVVSLAAVDWWWGIALYGILLLLSRYTLLRPRKRIWVISSLVLLSLGLSITSAQRDVTYRQFSLGSADAAVVQDNHHTYVVDTGEHGGDLAGYLLSTGRKVDVLIITHLHADHVGGLKQLLEQKVAIQEIWLAHHAENAPDTEGSFELIMQALKAGIPVRRVGAGDMLHSDRVKAEVVWPYQDKTYPGLHANDMSMAIWWDLDGIRLLTTGDLSGSYENYAAYPSEVLKVTHHGSKTATRADFLAAVNPQVAILPIAENQLERTQDVVQRLEAISCKVYTTHHRGALCLTIKDDQLRVSHHLPERQQHESR